MRIFVWNTALLLCLASLSTMAQELELPRPSPKARVMQRMGIADLEVVYSSPGVKDREIWGGLVPYGQVWRTGANAATQLHLSKSVVIAGEEVPAGRYALFTIPGQDTWTLILNEKWEQWGAGNYDPKYDVLRTQIEPEEAERFQERLLFYFDLENNQRGRLILHWAELSLPIEVEAPVVEQSLASIEAALNNNQNDWKMLRDAADFCLDYEVRPKQAITWINRSIRKEKDFSNMWVKAQLLAQQGDYDKAVKWAEKARPMLEEKSEGYRNFYDGVVTAELRKWKVKQ